MMKILFMFYTCLLFAGGPELKFTKNRLVNYGTIKAGEVARVKVGIKNVGDEDLIILTPIVSCNCTSVDYPRDALAPNDSSSVNISVNTTDKSGPETVIVKLLTNTKEKYSVIRIDLDVQR